MAEPKISKRRLFKDIKLLKKHVIHLLRRDNDILKENDKEVLSGILSNLKRLDINSSNQNLSEVRKNIDQLSNKYTSVIPVKKFKIIREYAEIIVVALTVAFGIRALYVQPFKIPTSSMQPSLFGIHYIQNKSVPTLPQPLNYLLFSTEKAELITKQAGMFEGFYPPFNKYGIFPWTALEIGDVNYKLPGTPQQVAEYCFLKYKQGALNFPADYTIVNGWLSDGDHLFVNRLIYHFSEPKRGDIVVFTTDNLYSNTTGQPLDSVGYYFVKRLVGLPGDTMKIVNKMLYIKPLGAKEFKPVTDFGIQAFKNIYSEKGGYQGYFPVGMLATGKEVHVPLGHYFMLGDNSYWSDDSRYWGFVPRNNIVGKVLFVFWPFSRRWGMVGDTLPLDTPTTIGENGYIKAMSLQ